jgi:hypothetical protein
MLKQTKYILVIIVILLVILYFIKYFKSLDNIKDNFTTEPTSLNEINPRCNPTILLPSSSNFCDCSGSNYLNKYALYDSNDNKTYGVIAKCSLGDNEWRWRAVANTIKYSYPNYDNCDKSDINESDLYACKSEMNNRHFSLWDIEKRKWVVK